MKWKKRTIWGIFLLYLIGCIFFTCYQALQESETVATQSYGTSSDGTILLKSGKEVACEFELTYDTLEGISVKFQADGTFDEEELWAGLYDADTGELLAECVIALKNERIQNTDSGSTIYFSLPVSGAAGLKVRVVFELSGEEIQTCPSFVTSKNAAAESELYVNGEARKKNLVFTARYSLGTSRDVAQAVLNGILYLALGTVVFLWIYRRPGSALTDDCGTDANLESADVHSSRIWKMGERLCAFIRKYARILGYFLLIACLCAMLLYVYMYAVRYPSLESGMYFLRKLYGILGILLLAAASLLYYAIVVKKLQAERLFVAMALPFGVIFSLVIALYTVPDEPSHIDTAYAISNELLGIEESEKPGYIYKRACDADMNTEEKQSLTADSWERLYSQLFTMADDTTLVECAARSNLNNAGKIYYLPQALGITAGRILGLGMMPTMMLGRLMNLLCYILIVYFAIRKLPVAKTSMLLIACLPITLQQAASFSYDGMINAISFLYVSYCVYALYGEKLLSVRDFFVLALTGCLLASVKGGVYVPLCLLPLAVFFRKDRIHQAQRKYFAALALLFVFAFAKGNLASLMSRLLAAQGTRSGGASGSEVYTMGYLLKNPLHALGLFVNTFYKQWDSYLRNLLGGNLAWREINIKWTVVFATLLILLLSCLRSEKEPFPGRMEKGYTGFLCFGCYCCIELSMLLAWTPVTYTYITGVQGRYFLPFFFLILFLLRNSLVSLKRNIDRQLIFAAGMVNVITILQVVQLVLE